MQRLLKTARSIGRKVMLGIYHAFIRLFSVKSNIIIFECNLGRSCTGNPGAIYEEMQRQGLNRTYSCFFVTEKNGLQIPCGAKAVRKNSLRYFYLFAVAGIWISDTRLPRYMIKRPACFYLQTWHGTPLKKLALDMEAIYMSGETSVSDYKKSFIENTGTWDCLISQNGFSTAIFRRAFDFKKEILEIGYPRNDILFHKNNPRDIHGIKKELGLPEDKKIILYAPTWRDNEYYSRARYRFNPRLDFKLLMEELGREAVVLIKYHYLTVEKEDWSLYGGFIRACDAGYDIASLYLACDMLITDYSSAMFDFSILNKPLLFYCYDLEEYRDILRGFYFDFLEEAPGPVVKTTEELIQAIKQYDYTKYEARYEAFRRRYNHADDGRASEKVVSHIRELQV